MKRFALLIGMVLAVGMIWGCRGKVPYGYSFDRHEFLSTYERPMTIIIEERMTGKELWRKDIPIEHRLIIEFSRPTDNINEGLTTGMETHRPATEMDWRILDSPTGFTRAELDNNVQLPGTPIRMRMEIRPYGEKIDQPVPTAEPTDTATTMPSDDEVMEEEKVEMMEGEDSSETVEVIETIEEVEPVDKMEAEIDEAMDELDEAADAVEETDVEAIPVE